MSGPETPVGETMRETTKASERSSGSLDPVDRPVFPLIDRERETAELRAALDSALGGSGRLVLLGGEPGIGKTRLASALAGEAESRGVPVMWGRGFEDGSAPAFWSWNTALRRWIDRDGHDGVLAAAGSWGAELAQVFSVLREHVAVLPESTACESDAARFRLFDVVSRFLADVARPAGLVIVLDDVHWADLPSLKLLEFIASDLSDTRILVAATYRDTEVQRDDPFFMTLSRLARATSTRRLALAGLAPADLARWIEVAGIEGDALALGRALHRETNGNPFFVGEIVRLLIGQETSDRGTRGEVPYVPNGVREVIAQRLDRLGDGCRATLAVAALLGDAIDVRMLVDVLGDDLIADHLERASHDRILVEGDGRPGTYVFAHALIRTVLADELAPSARAAWHARIAAVLERRASASEVVTTQLVHHLAAAGTPEALRKAFDYARQGGERAARGLGWEEAVRLHEIALDVGRRSGLLDSRPALELELALARALRGAGDVPAARERCEQVMAACRRTSDPEAFARAALIHAGPIPEWGRIEPVVRAVLEEACRAAPALDDALRARLYARLAGDLIAANAFEEGTRILSLCAEAAAAARRAGANDALAMALLGTFTAAVTELGEAAPGEDMQESRDALAAAEASGEHEYGAAIRYLRAMMLLARGEAKSFRREIDHLATAAASRVPEALWFADVLASLRAAVQGRFGEAREVMERALATGQRAHVANAVGVYASQRIMWHALQGRLAEIGPDLEAFVDVHPMGAGCRPFRALARLAQGDAMAARVEYQALIADGLAPAERGVMARTYLVGLAALCVALREREHAPMLYDCIARRNEAWSIGGGQTLGPWALLLGSLARLCGRPADAERHFETAIRLARHMGSAPIVARAQSMLASLRLSQRPEADERERIATMLAEAGRCAQEIGLVDVTARVARLSARLAQRSIAAELQNRFRCDGDVWTVCFHGRDLRVKDGKGPRYLAALLAGPGQDRHVLELAGSSPASGIVSAVAEGLTVGELDGPLEDAPDPRAQREYRERLEDLRAELDEAEQLCDRGRAERIREELDLLVSQLAQRFGSRVRTRSSSETARKAVTKVLRTQIAKLIELHPDLGKHLRDSVRMGTFCSYTPRTPIDWDVGFAPS